MTEVEEVAGDRAHRFLALVEAGASDELAQFTRTLPSGELVFALLAIAEALLRQEGTNERLTEANKRLEKQNKTLDTANRKLFGDRLRLTGELAEAREIREAQAVRMAAMRAETKEAA